MLSTSAASFEITAAFIRVASGSSTVAIAVAAKLLAPMIASDTPVNPELLVLSIGFGSLFLSHLNDGGFWIVSEGLGLNVRQMLQSWTIVESIIGVVGLLLTLLANACLTRLPIAVILTVGGMARALKLFYIKLLYPMASY